MSRSQSAERKDVSEDEDMDVLVAGSRQITQTKSSLQVI